MGVVLNEVKQAEEILRTGEVGDKPTSTLFLLARYFRQKEGLTPKPTRLKLDEFMRNNYKNYNSANWEDILENIAGKALKYPLREIDHIGITQKELDVISYIHNIKYEKLLFTMLCYAKLYDLISETNNGWINTDIQEIYRTARVTVKYRKDKFLYLNDLEQSGLIEFSNKNDNLNMRISFMDHENEPILFISDFRELGYEYQQFIGDGRFVRCVKCGMLIKLKSKNDHLTKYCKGCLRIVKNEQNRFYYHKKNNSD